MNDDSDNRVSLTYAMPFDSSLIIKSSQPVDEDIDFDKEIEGVVYTLWWDNTRLPWCTSTLLEANAIASGCHWGANEALKRCRQRKL